MYTEAHLYDLLSHHMNDHPGETEQLADLIRRERPHCRTLLDVGCGTGENVRLLGEVHGFEVDGIDLSPAMIAIARAKCPRSRLEVADMTNFDLGRRYDGVLCMFGSIGHVVTPQRLREALTCLRDHLAPGGVLLVLPYRTPDAVEAGTGEYTIESGTMRITRTRRSEIDGQRQRLYLHYVVEAPDRTWDADEVHEFGLFTVDEMLAAFADVGLAATFDPSLDDGLGSRGVYVASVQS